MVSNIDIDPAKQENINFSNLLHDNRLGLLIADSIRSVIRIINFSKFSVFAEIIFIVCMCVSVIKSIRHIKIRGGGQVFPSRKVLKHININFTSSLHEGIIVLIFC